MKILFNIFLIVLSVLQMVSCKPKDPPKLIVTVVDSADVKVVGATINITSSGYKNGKPQQGIVKASGVTDSDGSASFDFKLDAIVNVKAYKLNAAGDSLKGSSMAKLISGEITECTVKIRRNR
jgi:hypothetical protein